MRKQIIEHTDRELRSNSAFPTAMYGLDLAFKTFKERVEFYKKYSHPNTNVSYKEDIPLEIIKQYDIYLKTKNFIHTVLTWNNWLFDYCFGDIIKNDWDKTVDEWGNSTVDMPD